MKELVIGFLIALFVSSYMNSNAPAPFQNGWNFGAANLGLPDPINDVNAGTFQGEVLDSHTPVLAEFYTQSDPHSTAMKPALSQLATESQGFVRIVRIDADANAALTQRYDIKSYPSFVLFKEGKAVNGTSGEMEKKDLENWVKKELDIPTNQ
ncbi:MAG: thioredoxin family protein [Cyanobacteria bacterium REEB67]|nr:thioredoxin family protein [Cyanobacteria bacterium REEB67]